MNVPVQSVQNVFSGLSHTLNFTAGEGWPEILCKLREREILELCLRGFHTEGEKKRFNHMHAAMRRDFPGFALRLPEYSLGRDLSGLDFRGVDLTDRDLGGYSNMFINPGGFDFRHAILNRCYITHNFLSPSKPIKGFICIEPRLPVDLALNPPYWAKVDAGTYHDQPDLLVAIVDHGDKIMVKVGSHWADIDETLDFFFKEIERAIHWNDRHVIKGFLPALGLTLVMGIERNLSDPDEFPAARKSLDLFLQRCEHSQTQSSASRLQDIIEFLTGKAADLYDRSKAGPEKLNDPALAIDR